MNRQSHKQESFNLGDPLPLTYLPSNQNKPKTSRFTSVNELPPAPAPAPAAAPEPITTSYSYLAPSKNINGESNFRIVNRAPSIRRTSQNRIEDRIRKKLTQLNQELDGIAYEVSDFELIDIKLDEVLDLINDLKSQKRDIQGDDDDDDDNSQVDELLKKLESAKAKANTQNSRIKSTSSWIRNNIYQSRYWLLTILVLIILFCTSSVLAADFKYRYCYYFC